MEVLFKNRDLEVFERGPDQYGVVIYDVRLANKVNRTFKTYEGYQIKKYEEPLYSFSGAEMGRFLILMPKGYRDTPLNRFLG